MNRLLLTTSVPALLGSMLAAQLAPAAATTREAGVLAVLRQLDPLDQSWLVNSTFVLGRTAAGAPFVQPNIPITCGNSHLGCFDAARARRLARELCVVYGLQAKTDVVAAEPGVAAVLDLHDAARKVTIELRGIAPAPATFAEPGVEPPEHALDDAEGNKLQAAGHRVFAVDMKDFPLMDGDQYTPSLAFLAGVVAFLNESTEGADVRLDAVLGRREQRLELGKLVATTDVGVRREPSGVRVLTAAKAATTVSFTIDGAKCEERDLATRETAIWTARDRPIPTAGMPTRLTLHVPADARGSTMVVTQRLANGTAIEVAASGMSALLPSEFDAGRPFAITLRLPPGNHYLHPHVVIGCPPR